MDPDRYNRGHFTLTSIDHPVSVGPASLFDLEYNKDTTPLEKAVYIRNLKEVQDLVEQGADVNKVNNKGRTPIHIIINNPMLGYGDTKNELAIAYYLIEHGADIFAPDGLTKKTPVDAVYNALYGKTYRAEIATFILNVGKYFIKQDRLDDVNKLSTTLKQLSAKDTVQRRQALGKRLAQRLEELGPIKLKLKTLEKPSNKHTDIGFNFK